MRSLLLLCEMIVLLPIALIHPFVGVLIFYWISFMNPQQISWGIGTYPPWALIAFVFTITGWVVSPVEPKKIVVTPYLVLMILFVIGITINMPFSLSPFATEYEAWLRTTKIFLFLIITVTLLTNKRRIDALIWIMIISIGYYILDQGGATLVTLGGHKAVGPPKSQIGDNNVFAAAVLILVPMMNYLRLQSRYPLIRAGFMLAMAISILVSVASYSRGALLGLIAVAGVFWLRSKHKISSLLALGCTLTAVLAFMPQKWWDRMSTLAHHQTDKSAVTHLLSWRMGWDMALRRPLTGGGFHFSLSPEIISAYMPDAKFSSASKFADATWHEIHSIWLQMLGEQGFIVFFIWLGMLLAGVFESWRVLRLTRGMPEFAWANDLARMGQISILAYGVTGTFLPISTWDVFFTMLAVICATRLVVTRELAEARSTPEYLAWRPAPAIKAIARVSTQVAQPR